MLAKELKGAITRATDRVPTVQAAAADDQELAEIATEGPDQRPSPVPVATAPTDALEQNAAEEPCLALCLVYAPNYIPDVVVQALSMPCSVNHALIAFAQRRDASQAACFDQIFPASPQPDRKLAVAVAMPSWATDRIGVLFNCLAINRTLFAAAVHPRLNRISLLLAAGLDSKGWYDIFLHGLSQPLPDDILVDLRSGTTICIVPYGAGPLQSWNLEDMLQDPTEWDHEAQIPGPPPPAGERFWTLTDGMPLLFKVEPGRRRHVQEDIVRALGYSEARTTIKTTRPRIIDHLQHGFPTWAILVATEQLCTVPVPPGRSPEHRYLLVLDCRAALLGFRWMLAQKPWVLPQDIANLFTDYCLPTHMVAVKGAAVTCREEGVAAEIIHGQVLKIEFVAESDSESSDQLEEPAPGSEGASSSPHDIDLMQVESPEEVALHPPERDNAQASSERSRSPRLEEVRGETSCEDAPQRYTFGILTPSFVIETVTVHLRPHPSIHTAFQAIQAQREASSALAFPLLQPVSRQPCEAWACF